MGNTTYIHTVKRTYDHSIMTRKLKYWRSTIPSISTKRTITSHLNTLNTKTGATYYVGNPDHSFGQTHRCCGVKPVNWLL